MDGTETFREFVAAQSVHVEPMAFAINLGLAALLAAILGSVYIHYGSALSNRRSFASTILLLAMITMVVISIVKSSLALSLGLVGALSIVRFRTAIKEPEELTYLFLAIAIGLGFGADQRWITLIAFVMIIAAIVFGSRRRAKQTRTPNLMLNVSGSASVEIRLDMLISILDIHCIEVDLNRFDQSADGFEALFQVSLENVEHLETLRKDLTGLDGSIRISFIEQPGLAL